MTETQIQNDCLQRPDTKCVNQKEPKNLITAETVVHGWEAKAKVQTTASMIWCRVPKGVVQKPG